MKLSKKILFVSVSVILITILLTGAYFILKNQTKTVNINNLVRLELGKPVKISGTNLTVKIERFATVGQGDRKVPYYTWTLNDRVTDERLDTWTNAVGSDGDKKYSIVEEDEYTDHSSYADVRIIPYKDGEGLPLTDS